MLQRCLTFLMLAVAAARPGQPAELTGVITQVQGAVRLEGPGVGSVPLASPWQTIRVGVSLRLPEKAAAGIVCSNRHFVRLKGPVSWSLSAPACAAGTELTQADYALVAPQAGRFKVVHGLLVLEREMRSGEDDDPLSPVVLGPRNTVLRSPRPAVAWLRVPSATEYLVEWTGRGASSSIQRLDAADLSCPAGRDGAAVCSLPWPADRSDLPPGEIFFLTVAAREGIAEPWHKALPVEVRTQTIADAGILEARLREAAGLGLDEPALEVVQAGLLAGNGLYTDAAEDYRRALETTPSAELEVTLADLYLMVGLYRFAEPLYQKALTAEAPAVRAAATFGLGRVEYARGQFKQAAESFRKAGDLYAGLKLSDEEAACREAAEKAVKRTGRLSLAPSNLQGSRRSM